MLCWKEKIRTMLAGLPARCLLVPTVLRGNAVGGRSHGGPWERGYCALAIFIVAVAFLACLAAILDSGMSSSAAVPLVCLEIPAPACDPVIPVKISSNVIGAWTFQVDVDLNHDGEFNGPGELAYTAGALSEDGKGTARLRGLVHGSYRG